MYASAPEPACAGYSHLTSVCSLANLLCRREGVRQRQGTHVSTIQTRPIRQMTHSMYFKSREGSEVGGRVATPHLLVRTAQTQQGRLSDQAGLRVLGLTTIER